MTDLRFPGRSEMLGTLAMHAATEVSVDALIARLKADVFRARLRLREFFKDFDPLRAGVVSEAKFRTALDESGLKLNDPEMQQLASHFADPTDRKRVRYEALLSQIESVFTTAGMETDPNSNVADFTPTLKRITPMLSEEEEQAVAELLSRLSHTVKVRQLLIRPTFNDYYKNVNSPILVDQVTQAQFRNGLSSLGLQINSEEAELLNKKFAGQADGYVDYVAFAVAVDEAERIFSTREPRSHVEQPLSSGFRAAPYHAGGTEAYQPGRAPTNFNQPQYPGSAGSTPMNSQLETLLSKLQDLALKHRLRVAEFFREFDKHSDGTVTQPQFIKRLSVAYDKMGIGLNEDEIQLLLDAYGKRMRHGAMHVQWRKFVDDIEKIFVTKGMEKDPSLTPGYRTLQQDPKTLEPPTREMAVQKLIADLRKRVEVRRVLVKPLFNDYGSWSSSTRTVDHVTRQQMVQSLSRFGIELDAAQAALLFDRYDTLGTGSVNMVALVRDIDAYESFSSRQMSRHTFPQDPDFGSRPTMNSGFWKDRVVPGPIVNVQPGRPPMSNDQPTLVPHVPEEPPLTALLQRLQATAVQHRIRVEECFKDFDRHRDGSITVPQFQSALAMTFSRQTPLSQAECEMLIRAYAVDKSGQTHVQWKRFVKDVSAIFVATGLEKNPTAAAPPLIANLPRPQAMLTMEEEATAQSVLARMRKHCSHRRVLVKPFFSDAEYNRRSMRVVDHITKAQFGQVLSRLGLELNNDELELLGRKFDDKGDGFVNYVAFASAVDEEEQGSDRNAPMRFPAETFKANGNFKAPKTADVQPGRPPVSGDTPALISGRDSTLALGALMRRLQEKVIQFQIPISDFFSDYDKHKLGAISAPQFRRGLNFAFGTLYVRESLTSEEIELLEATYAREMLDGALFVDWKEFCKDIKAAILTPGLEKVPHVLPSPVIPSLGHSPVTLSPTEEARVQELLSEMRERFRIRAVYVKAPFHDFAKSNNSPVMVDRCTRQQFVQGLSRLGIEPQASDLELLFKKYDDAGEGAVNYVKFSTDVDSTETFSDRMRMPRSPVANTTFYGGFRVPKVHEELLKSM